MRSAQSAQPARAGWGFLGVRTLPFVLALGTAACSGGTFDVFKMKKNDNNQVNLTDDPAIDLSPDWQPLTQDDGDDNDDD